MKATPLYDHVLILPDEREGQAGEIFIADSAQNPPQKATVIGVGPGKKNDQGKFITPMVKLGDRVMFKKWGLTGMKIDSKEHFFLKETELLAVLEE